MAMLKHLGANQAIMSRGVFEQEQIARAVELKLGASGPKDIELVAAGAESQTLADIAPRDPGQGVVQSAECKVQNQVHNAECRSAAPGPAGRRREPAASQKP